MNWLNKVLACIVVLLAVAVLYLWNNNPVVWAGDATMIAVEMEYNHLTITMKGADGRKFYVQEALLLVHRINDNVEVFHCKVRRFGNGECK